MFFLKHWFLSLHFNYLKMPLFFIYLLTLFEMGCGKRVSGEIIPFMFHFLDDRFSRSWSRPSSQTFSSVFSCQWQAPISHHVQPPRVHASRKFECGAQSELLRHFSIGCRHPKQLLNSPATKPPPPIWYFLCYHSRGSFNSINNYSNSNNYNCYLSV